MAVGNVLESGFSRREALELAAGLALARGGDLDTVRAIDITASAQENEFQDPYDRVFSQIDTGSEAFEPQTNGFLRGAFLQGEEGEARAILAASKYGDFQVAPFDSDIFAFEPFPATQADHPQAKFIRVVTPVDQNTIITAGAWGNDFKQAMPVLSVSHDQGKSFDELTGLTPTDELGEYWYAKPIEGTDFSLLLFQETKDGITSHTRFLNLREREMYEIPEASAGGTILPDIVLPQRDGSVRVMGRFFINEPGRYFILGLGEQTIDLASMEIIEKINYPAFDEVQLSSLGFDESTNTIYGVETLVDLNGQVIRSSIHSVSEGGKRREMVDYLDLLTFGGEIDDARLPLLTHIFAENNTVYVGGATLPRESNQDPDAYTFLVASLPTDRNGVLDHVTPNTLHTSRFDKRTLPQIINLSRVTVPGQKKGLKQLRGTVLQSIGHGMMFVPDGSAESYFPNEGVTETKASTWERANNDFTVFNATSSIPTSLRHLFT